MLNWIYMIAPVDYPLDTHATVINDIIDKLQNLPQLTRVSSDVLTSKIIKAEGTKYFYEDLFIDLKSEYLTLIPNPNNDCKSIIFKTKGIRKIGINEVMELLDLNNIEDSDNIIDFDLTKVDSKFSFIVKINPNENSNITSIGENGEIVFNLMDEDISNEIKDKTKYILNNIVVSLVDNNGNWKCNYFPTTVLSETFNSKENAIIKYTNDKNHMIGNQINYINDLFKIDNIYSMPTNLNENLSYSFNLYKSEIDPFFKSKLSQYDMSQENSINYLVQPLFGAWQFDLEYIGKEEFNQNTFKGIKIIYNYSRILPYSVKKKKSYIYQHKSQVKDVYDIKRYKRRQLDYIPK